jgi:hypothetical protein
LQRPSGKNRGRLLCTAAALLVAATLAGIALTPLPTGAIAATPDELPTPTSKAGITVVPVPHRVHTRVGPLVRGRTKIENFETAPFPYHGVMPRSGTPFLNVLENGRRGHRTGGGHVYWEDETYSDSQVLMHLPKGFDIRRPGLLIVFFHGHGAKLAEDVYLRQKVSMQLSASGVNAALIAPQLAVKAADSSAGKFWQPGAFGKFLAEAAQQLGKLHGDPRAWRAFTSMPVVIVAYSGGYLTTAYCVHHGGIGNRLQGVVLFDALYGEVDIFTSWVARKKTAFFVSTYTPSTLPRNLQMQKLLAERRIPFTTELDPRLEPGSIAFLSAPRNATHHSFLTYAWVDDPLKNLLDRLRRYARR